jgi:hypothetical protein
MITSYIVDGEHILDELTGPNSRKATEALCCLTDWIVCKGILCTRKEWLDPLRVWSSSSDVETDIAVDEFLGAEPRIAIDRETPWVDHIGVDCMVGQAVLPPIFRVSDRFPLSECKSRDRKKRRKDMEGKKRYSESKRAQFEDFIRKISWHSKTFMFFDKIWGEKAAAKPGGNARDIRKSDCTRKRFAESFSYLVELILGCCVWGDDEIQISIHTVPCANIVNAARNRTENTEARLMESLTDSLLSRKEKLSQEVKSIAREIDKLAWAGIKASGASTFAIPQEVQRKQAELGVKQKTERRLGLFLDKCLKAAPSVVIHVAEDDEHDRFLKTDFHSYSFGRGFDILDDGILRGINVYWAEESKDDS